MRYWKRVVHTACVAAACVAVSACDSITSLELRVNAGKPIDAACLSKLENALGPIDGFNRATQASGSTAESVQIVRGRASVEVNRTDSASQVVGLNVLWRGPSDEQRQKDAVKLVADVRNAIIRACELEGSSVALVRCSRDLCKHPESAALTAATR